MDASVLLVDDSRVILHEMKMMLADSGFQIVDNCRDGQSALDAYARHRPDLVTMDVVMPGMDGLTAAERIRSLDPTAKIILVTSLEDADTMARAKEFGVSEFLNKPFDKDTLLETLRRVLAGG